MWGTRLRAIRGAVSAASLILIAGLAAVPAAAAQGWSMQQFQLPADFSTGTMSDVSCAARACIAVGYYDTTSNTQSTWAEQWNGSDWQLLSTPSPGSSINQFDSVSCVGSSFCMAVGTVFGTWNGTQWTIMPATPGNAVGERVSCWSADGCTVIVGDDGAASWNGTTWTSAQMPSPLGGAQIHDLWCRAKYACTAAGEYHNLNQGQPYPLIERSSGPGWSFTTVPSDDSAGELSGVSCVSGGCVTVGETKIDAAQHDTLADEWPGKNPWSVMPPASGANDGTASLSGVSCTSMTSCIAVGGNDEGVLAEYWDGSAWTAQSTPQPSRQSRLGSVSCTAALTCEAIGATGSSPGQPLAEGYTNS